VELIYAIMDDNSDVVKLYLYDPSIHDNKALMIVVQGQSVDIVRMLLTDPRVDSNARNRLAYTMAKAKF